MTHRRTEAEDFTVAQQRACRCFGAAFGSPGERILLLLVRPCASTADRQPSLTYYQVALRCSGHLRVYQLTHESECTCG
jgi:hypothetical protein